MYLSESDRQIRKKNKGGGWESVETKEKRERKKRGVVEIWKKGKKGIRITDREGGQYV